ncbi:glutathione S-transferase kappa 1 isoform X2 [Octopus bimaculoides]|uniref:Glutathione S-transferase kappa n=1 Tax=Octopus bimaculoides TaxID=37653 RepID=A0A0L8GGY6_OCTBM|nr:glutathione S-transferase kappa 1 isoform X2 [Octopus bimaculoides]|eukprot:XP_014781111.1 PREDICTED: glutathione S-transferase kappa 1-like isoform X2 [Octopus bimaculoides]
MASSAPRKLVELFYDVVSPYSWLAFEVLNRYKNYWNINLCLKPVFLGGIMQKTGNKPPALGSPEKAKYLFVDIQRMSKYFDVPLKLPSDPFTTMFGKGSLNAQRFITAIDMMEPKFTGNISQLLWMRIHGLDKDITEIKSFQEVGEQAGIPPNVLTKALSRISDVEIKNRLKEYTDEAIEKGAFGLPAIVAHVNNEEQMIFGCDRFPILALILNEHWNGPYPAVNQSKL